ncbi:hypothetical protein [Rhodanobacter panaciterrae]|nr:hypothetical protein [Rhodanobacter panaciterrae]
MASTYYFITSMGVDAPVAAAIRKRLLAAGVSEAHVLGREWLTSEIKSSARLRALVPRVYGLGDLSAIVDERSASQTRTLLGHLLPGLKVYVPTFAHRTAVRTLGSHKLVLLLGAPATGKSMLAAILATMAIDTDHLECIKCEGPLEMRPRWNPNEPRKLFWVDDAFGPNQLRDDYVDAWIEFMPKMKAAIEQGNHFILTSRTHIWNEAKHKLGTRNHPLLANGKSIVNVGQLSPEERQQILYNHVKAGQQPENWKTLIKPHLPALAEQVSLLPEIARRLGDPNYTSAVRTLPEDLVRFVREPEEFLKGTIRELVVAQQAAMTLVFLARSRLPVYGVAGEECKLVAEKYATSVSAVTLALEQLEGAFLIKREERGDMCWGFVHPTFADAVSSILSGRPDLVELYLRGAKVETLLAEAVCEGAPTVDDAVVVPDSSIETLISRLLEIPDEGKLNERLFQFLNRRAPRSVVERVLHLSPHLLNRKGSPSPWMVISRHAEILLRATAFSMNLLDEELRLDTRQALENAVHHSLDASYLSEENILAIFRPHELITLTIELVGMLEDTIPSEIANLESNADADGDIDDQFERVSSFVREVRWIVEGDERMRDRLDDLDNDIEAAKTQVEARKSREESESFFTNVPSAAIAEEATCRSIFSDIDE